MAIGSGIGGSLGAKIEAAYGTYLAPTSWLEIDKESLTRNQKTILASGLAAGRLVDLAARRVMTTEDGNGTTDHPVWDRGTSAAAGGMGKLFTAIFGGTVTPTVIDTTAFTQTYDIADTFGKSLTLQAGIPNSAGTVLPYTFLGCKATSATWECGIDGFLNMSTDWDIRQVIESQTLVAPAYATGTQPFHFGQATVGVGTAASIQATAATATTVLDGVRKISIKVDRKQATDRYYFGNTVSTAGAMLKSEPIMNDQVVISGSIELDVTAANKTALLDKFAAGTAVSMTFDCVSLSLAGAATAKFTTRFQMTSVFADGETPKLDGPGVVSVTVPFVALGDATLAGGLRLIYISTDSAL